MEEFEFLKKIGVSVAPYRVFTDVKEVQTFVKKNSPVALKILGKEHKTDIGGVKLYLNGIKEFNEAVKELKQRFPKRKLIVQKMLKGVELIIGIKRDQQFGKVIMLGIGGIYVELYKDVSIRLLPITKKDVYEMIDELRGKKALKEFRGIKVNTNAIVKTMLNISKNSEMINEMDINPAIANEKGVFAVDARIW